MNKTETLADLLQRAANAAAIEDAADNAGDDRKRRRAAVRWWWRCLQVSYLEQRPDDAICPQCSWGETNWPAMTLFGSTPVWSCLEHADWLEREADERVALEDGV